MVSMIDSLLGGSLIRSTQILERQSPLRRVIEGDLTEIGAMSLPWASLDSASIVVTGGTGLVGAYFVEGLAAHARLHGTRGPQIVLISRSADRARQRFAHLRGARLAFLEQPLDAPIQAACDVDFVLHGASNADLAKFAADPIGTYVPNVIGTHHLLQWARKHGVRRVAFVSSGASHGSLETVTGRYDESVYGPLDPLDPYACYAESKRMGEAQCVAWWRQTGLETVIIRLSHTYGPGLSRGDSRAFAEFVFDAIDGRDIVLRTEGRVRRPFCYLTDAIAGMLLALTSGEPGTAYSVANDEAVLSIRDLAELIVRLAPSPGIRLRLPDPTHSLVDVLPTASSTEALPDTSRLRALGWSPQIDPEEGFRRTIAAHMAPGQ